MGFGKRVGLRGCALIRGVLAIGCTVQIVLGAVWFGCNFFQVQDFGEPQSALYRLLYGMLGENPCAVYLLQLAAAFGAGYCLLRKLRRKVFHPGSLVTVWGSLVMLSYPFGMQCHLAVLPDSLMGSLSLLMLGFLADVVLPREPLCFGGDGRRKGRVRLRGLAGLAVCAALTAALSGTLDRERREAVPEHSIQSALASRFAWPSLFNDASYWPEELQEMTKDVLWEATFYPGNLEILQEAVERSAGPEAAKGYYMQMTATGWKYRRPVVIRQIGWDMLGYAVTPLIVPGQLRGEGYDSCTGRNYEIMRGNAPVLTRHYVEYGCWWFGVCLALGLCLGVLQMLSGGREPAPESGGNPPQGRALPQVPGGPGILWGRLAALAAVFALAAGVWVFLLSMRGAGWMDYKCTIAVNELWLCLVVLLMGGKCGEGTAQGSV